MTYGFVKQGPGSEQAQQCGRLNWFYDDSTDVNKLL
jgi:hypothetical protein